MDKQHEQLRFYLSSGDRVGIATLRRDGFASVGSPEETRGATLLTVPLTFHTNKTALFLNIRGGGVSRVDVLAPTMASDPKLLLSMVEGIPSDTDSTMMEVKLRAGAVANLAALRGKPFRLSIKLGAKARLYAFWLSEGSGGQSGGWLGAGGPAYPGGLRDVY